MNILAACRDARDGAYIRTMNGDSIGDNAYGDVIFDAAMALAAETGIPFRRLRAALWWAADMGADRALRDMTA